jgi:ribosomal protein S18 acetylase RimI-like enzyme
VRLQRVQPGDAARLRDVRLRALHEAPDAFATSFEEASARPPEYWEEWTRAPVEEQVTIVAVDGDHWVGIVSGWVLEDRPGKVWLARLWVDPATRGTGLGLELIDAIAEWGRERGCATVDLSVTANNTAAAALYARAGFVETGRRRPLPADPSRTEVFLTRTRALPA